MANSALPTPEPPGEALARRRLGVLRWRALLLTALALPAALARPSAAVAQPAQAVPHEAEKLYADAAAAMIKKDYATACPKFEQVTGMVPDGGGARLNLAQCYEEWGKLASALGQYQIAETLAKKDGRKDRLKTASKGVDRLKGKVASLVVDVPDAVRAAPGLEIKIDSEVLSPKSWGVPYPVDRGPHTLLATAKGYRPTTVQVSISKDGTTTSTSIPPLERAPEVALTAAPTATAPPTASAPAAAGEGGLSPQARTATMIGGGALALGGIVAGGVFLGASFAKDSEWQKAQLDPYGRDAAKSAAKSAADAQSAAIWCFVGGGAAAAATVAFVLATRPRAKAQASAGAFLGPGGAAVWVQGHF